MNVTDVLVHADVNEIEAQVLSIPYADEKLSMIIVLPNEESDILKVTFS